METKKMKNEAHDKAVKASKKHNKIMAGKKTILVPHPTVPKTFIEKIVDND